MKKVLLSSAAIIAFAGSALAADLPSRKAPVAPPAVPLWTGFYAGLNAGYGWGTNSNTSSSLTQTVSAQEVDVNGFTSLGVGGVLARANLVSSPFSSSLQSMTQSGFNGGAQFGYNYQWGNNIIIGIETDIGGSAMRGGSKGSSLLGGSSPATVSNFTIGGTAVTGNGSLTQTGYSYTAVSGGVDWLGTVRGRVGYLWTPTLMVYGTGGLAYGGVWANVTSDSATTLTSTGTLTVDGNTVNKNRLSVSQSYVGGGKSNALLVGYSAGGGAEWMFMPNWSLKGEALYYNLGNMNVSTGAIASPAWSQTGNATIFNVNAITQLNAQQGLISGTTRINYQGVIARAGINYHFTWGSAPVIASF